MKNTLKGWVADNTVTPDKKDDKILILEKTGNLTLDDIIDLMLKQDTGLRRETQQHVVNLFLRTVAEQLLNGYAVNTGLFHAVARFKGLITGGVWNPKKNRIIVSIIQDKILREGIANTSIKILGEKNDSAYISGGEDTATRATNGAVTPGRNYHIKGRNIKLAGDHKDVGIFITDSSGKKTKLSDDMIPINNPSDILILLPVDLPDGACELTVVTQYSSNSSILLKTPRTMTQQIYIGDSPDEPGGGEVEDPTA